MLSVRAAYARRKRMMGECDHDRAAGFAPVTMLSNDAESDVEKLAWVTPEVTANRSLRVGNDTFGNRIRLSYRRNSVRMMGPVMHAPLSRTWKRGPLTSSRIADRGNKNEEALAWPPKSS
jgi:hypothetical protein